MTTLLCQVDAVDSESENLPKRLKVAQKKPANFFKARTSPSRLYNLIQQLSDTQKEAVKDIGFGSLLSLGISKCPIEISRQLVSNFDFNRKTLILKNGHEIEIDEEDVESVLNIPRGDIEIIESIGKDLEDPQYNDFLKGWRTRWGLKENKGAPSTMSMVNSIIDNQVADNNFKIDFVVYVVSTFFWGSQNQQSRFKIIKSLMDVENIKNLNWCNFTLKALVESTRKWHRNNKYYFDGPLTFLLLCYLDRVEFRVRRPFERQFPIISCWDDKKVSERIALETTEGFGLGRAVARFPIPTECPSTSHLQIPKNIASDIPKSLEQDQHEMLFLVSQDHNLKVYTSKVVKAFKNMAEVVQHLEDLSDEMSKLKMTDASTTFEVEIGNHEEAIKRLKAKVLYRSDDKLNEDNMSICPLTEEQNPLSLSPQITPLPSKGPQRDDIIGR